MCTEFILPQATRLPVSGRTMDFAREFPWQVVAVPRGTEQRAVHLPLHLHPVARWKAQYGFMGIGIHEPGGVLADKTVDAMNDAGLSAAALWLPGSEYPRVKEIPETTALVSCLDIASWAVSNYATVADLRADLERIAAGEATAAGEHLAFWDPLQLPAAELDAAGAGAVKNFLPLHFQFHDRSGASLVMEFRNGAVELTDNSDLGVMTNAPFIDWQRTNLSNYLSVTNVEVDAATVVGFTLNKSGNGGGALALSVSAIPAERFVRTAFLLSFAQPQLAGASAAGATALAVDLLDNVTVPRGMCLDKAGETKGDYTQWKIVRDHANDRFYLTTAGSIGAWSVDFSDYDLTEGAGLQTALLVDAVAPPALPKGV